MIAEGCTREAIGIESQKKSTQKKGVLFYLSSQQPIVVETIVYGDIDLGAIALSNSIHNLTDIYSRWDLFSLAIRQKPYYPVVPLNTLKWGLLKGSLAELISLNKES